MRDDLNTLPELLKTVSDTNGFFGVLTRSFGDSKKTYKIGLQENEYKSWRKVLTYKPYDPMNTNSYRYYFCGAGRHNDRKTYGSFYIEQNSVCRKHDIDLPEQMVTHLIWFWEMKVSQDAEHLEMA